MKKRILTVSILIAVLVGVLVAGCVNQTIKLSHRDIVGWALAIYNGENDRVVALIVKPDLPPETMAAIKADIRNLKPEMIRTDLAPDVVKAAKADLSVLDKLTVPLRTAGSLIEKGDIPSADLENEIIALVRLLSNKYLLTQ